MGLGYSRLSALVWVYSHRSLYGWVSWDYLCSSSSSRSRREYSMDVMIEPGWLSIVPPLAAIALALIFREVVISLFAGIWLGALFLSQYDPVRATLGVIDRFVIEALGDPDHLAIIVFSLLDRQSTRLNSSHVATSSAVVC